MVYLICTWKKVFCWSFSWTPTLWFSNKCSRQHGICWEIVMRPQHLRFATLANTMHSTQSIRLHYIALARCTYLGLLALVNLPWCTYKSCIWIQSCTAPIVQRISCIRWIRRVKPSGEVIEARYKCRAQAACTIVSLRRPTHSHTSIMLPKVGVTLFNWRYFSRKKFLVESLKYYPQQFTFVCCRYLKVWFQNELLF